MRQQWNRLQYIILRCNNQLSIPTTIEHDSIERFNTRAGEQSYHKPQHWWWPRRRWWDIDCNINLHWHLLHRHRCFWSPWNTTWEKREERLPLLLYTVNSRATCAMTLLLWAYRQTAVGMDYYFMQRALWWWSLKQGGRIVFLWFTQYVNDNQQVRCHNIVRPCILGRTEDDE